MHPCTNQLDTETGGRQGTGGSLCLSSEAFPVGEIAEEPMNIPHLCCFALDETVDPLERKYIA